jgi:zinc transporter 9
MSLSQPQLRLLSSIGVGILVGTSLIVIIPEGIEAISSHDRSGHSHGARSLQILPSISRSLSREAVEGRDGARFATAQGAPLHEPIALRASYLDADQLPGYVARRADAEKEKEKDASAQPTAGKEKEDRREAGGIPTFYVGLSLIMGFVLMFLIDRLPRHASESLQAPPPPREISLDNLGAESSQTDEESASFLGSLAPTPKQSRSLATTTGLVIHATADGIAMGASSSTSNTKLGFIIFFAILIHKAPAAFGLTSVLLKQGLSKRAARGHLAVFSLAAPAGAIGTWLLITLLGGGSFEGEGSNWWTGMLLLFSGGTFL